MIRYSAIRTMFLIMILFFTQLFSADDNQKVNVSLLTSSHIVSPVQSNILDILREELKNKELLSDDFAIWDLLIVVQELEKKVVISITTFQSLPKEVIESGSNSQIFYAYFEKDKSVGKTEKNQEIRKYVTSEFLSQFKQVIDSEIIIAQNDNIKKVCKEIVNNFVMKYIR